LRKKRWFLLFPALLLVPLLVGMAPMKLANKLARGGSCPQSQKKQERSNQHRTAQFLISYHHGDAEAVDSASPDQRPSYSWDALDAVPESFHSSIHIIFIPLRC
jgi:hypothetical protein